MLRFYIAAVVQLVEHPDMDREVAGSSPAIRSDKSLKAFAALPYSALLSLSELPPYMLRWFCTYWSTISSGSLPTVATK